MSAKGVSGISCVPSPENQGDENSWSSICKQGLLGAALVGASAFNVFGDPLIIVISVVVYFIFFALSQSLDNGNWFDRSVAKEKLKKILWVVPLFAVINLAFGCLMRFVAKASGVHQISLRVLVRAFREQNPLKFGWVFSNIIFISAVAEEIFFRGFVQEKIRDIEVFICNKIAKHPDGTAWKVARIALQALIFSACHFHLQQGLSNIALLGLTFVFGCWLGAEKEKGDGKQESKDIEKQNGTTSLRHENTLWKNVLIHSSWNTFVCLRVLTFRC